MVKKYYMADFKNQKERLLLFLKHKGLKNAVFEKMMGLSNGYINSMRKGLGYDKLEQISISFPELNIGWLLTSEGSMLKDENSNSRSILVPTLETRINVSQQEKTVPYYMYKDLQEENRKLEREIGRLEEQLKHLKDLIKKEENKSLITNFDSHAETVQKKQSSSRISGSSAQPDVLAIK